MCRAIQHRGPDGTGAHFLDACGLGHVRLSIIDIGGGAQPMLSKDKKKGVVFNGEIYGYKAIKERFSNYPFRTNSDTELLLALYEKYGERMAEHTPGMFSFALWDDAKRTLIAARDRFGEKPFYFAWGDNRELIFASEIKAILATGLVRPRLSKEATAHYFRKLYVHPKETIYKNVYTLPPGHMLIYADGRVQIKRYWELPRVDETLSLDEAAERFRALFLQAVERQLISDVPLGAFLSGGLDSSTVVAAASQFKPGIQTFSFGFGDSINELPYAREIAEKYRAKHTELQAGDHDVASLLMEMRNVYDEPFADSSNIPTYLICQQAREHVKVVLTGDGADELFGGYGWYKPLLHMGRFDTISAWRFWAARIIGSLQLKMESEKYALYRYAQGKRFSEKYRSVSEAHIHQNAFYNADDVALLGLPALDMCSYIPKMPMCGTPDDALRIDAVDYMPGDILVKTDRASMAHALELRAPFLDVDFASFALSVPYSLKVSSERDKIVMRKAVSDWWTDSVRKRGKHGFGAPVADWLALPEVEKLRKEYLDDRKAKVYDVVSFDGSEQFRKGRGYHTWILLTFALWAEAHEFELY
jgi:asparagine synthase (glutamine-hydrolysing)